MPECDDQTRALVERHDKELYRGNGNPGIVTRLRLLEDNMSEIRELLQESAKSRERKINIILGALITGLIGLVLEHFKII